MKLLSLIFTLFASILLYGETPTQIEFFKSVPSVGDKIEFQTVISTSQNEDAEFKLLREWAKENYGRDPFISSLRYDYPGKGITARSRIELVLPSNSKNVRDRIVMRYRIDVSINGQKCTVVFRDLSYLYENPLNNIALPKYCKATYLISDIAMKINDGNEEFRSNVRKSTLYFLNQTMNDLHRTLIQKTQK